MARGRDGAARALPWVHAHVRAGGADHWRGGGGGPACGSPGHGQAPGCGACVMCLSVAFVCGLEWAFGGRACGAAASAADTAAGCAESVQWACAAHQGGAVTQVRGGMVAQWWPGALVCGCVGALDVRTTGRLRHGAGAQCADIGAWIPRPCTLVPLAVLSFAPAAPV